MNNIRQSVEGDGTHHLTVGHLITLLESLIDQLSNLIRTHTQSEVENNEIVSQICRNWVTLYTLCTTKTILLTK